VLKPTATIELVYMDETGSTSAVVVNVPSTSSIATMDAQASALASLIAPMTDCVLVKIRYCYRSIILADISDAGSSPIRVAGVFYFSTGDIPPLGFVTVPSFKDTLLETSGTGEGVLIDTTNGDVMSFIVGLLDINASNVFGDVFASLVAAYRQSRV
jgi:hypothetical protein